MSSPTVGGTYQVTDTNASPHSFSPGTRVRVLRDNEKKGRWPAHRWLCEGLYDGRTVVQWLAAGDLEPATP